MSEIEQLKSEIESLQRFISSQNRIIANLYELLKDGEISDWLRQYSKGKNHNQKTLEYLDAKIKSEELAKELNL